MCIYNSSNTVSRCVDEAHHGHAMVGPSLEPRIRQLRAWKTTCTYIHVPPPYMYLPARHRSDCLYKLSSDDLVACRIRTPRILVCGKTEAHVWMHNESMQRKGGRNEEGHHRMASETAG
jgi:hypothetical protein